MTAGELAGPRFIVPRGLTAEQCVEFFNVVAEVQATATALERKRCAALCATEPTRWLAVDSTGHESVTKCDPSEDPEAWLDFAVIPLFTDEQVRAAILAERERIARQVDEMVSKWDGPYQRAGALIVAAIRRGD